MKQLYSNKDVFKKKEEEQFKLTIFSHTNMSGELWLKFLRKHFNILKKVSTYTYRRGIPSNNSLLFYSSKCHRKISTYSQIIKSGVSKHWKK